MRITQTHDRDSLIPPDTRRRVEETIGAIFKLLKEKMNGDRRIAVELAGISKDAITVSLERRWSDLELSVKGNAVDIAFAIRQGDTSAIGKVRPDQAVVSRYEALNPEECLVSIRDILLSH